MAASNVGQICPASGLTESGTNLSRLFQADLAGGIPPLGGNPAGSQGGSSPPSVPKAIKKSLTNSKIADNIITE